VTAVGGVAGVGFALLAAAGAGVVPGWFTSDTAVHEQAAVVWPWFVGLMPFAGVVYALDGVLIGAGDVGYLRNVTLAAALAQRPLGGLGRHPVTGTRADARARGLGPNPLHSRCRVGITAQQHRG
jgi:Na+-driven multidrug efflux pump